MISRAPTSPVLAFSGLSLAVAVWLGFRVGLSIDSIFFRKNPTELSQPEPATSTSEKTIRKRHVPPSTSQLLEDQVGVSVTESLENVISECKSLVDNISRDCRATNRKFRDIEFDLANDPNGTFYGLVDLKSAFRPPAVRRVTDLFDQPRFFSERPGEHNIYQGNIGDCWFLSALAAVADSHKTAIENLCIARDEEIGVYGFVFQRNGRWVNVIIDDQLFWSLPKFEELSLAEQELYHNDKEVYRQLTRNTGQSLYHAHSGLQGETWVPLIEKAFAKLHGDFSALNGGWTSEGIEDLTGGVSVILNTADILDPEAFWTSELLTDATSPSRLMGVCFQIPEGETFKAHSLSEGLVNNHAYAVLRARECRGKRFVVLRNPWGKKEWTGAWSDGSKFWTEGLGFVKGKNFQKDEEEGKEEEEESTESWFEVLEELDHVLGDDGEFVMEYKDFLTTWHRIEITTLLDSSWVVSSHWLRVPPQRPIHPWTFGDVTFSFTLSQASKVHVVLSQLDNRYFRSLAGLSIWGFDFVLYKRGDAFEEWECHGSSYCGLSVSFRSVSWQGELQQGDYVVWPRLDRWDFEISGHFEENEKKWDVRKLGRTLMNRTMSRAIASNYESTAKKRYIPKSISEVIKAKALGDDKLETTTTLVTTPAAPVISDTQDIRKEVVQPELESCSGADTSGDSVDDQGDAELVGSGAHVTGDDEDERCLWLGLKVFTKKCDEQSSDKNDGVVIVGWVKDSDE